MADCHQSGQEVEELESSILLIGPPNVGKSVIFNYFTGLDVGMANYPGTTVEFSVGEIDIGKDETVARHQLIDVPGTYTLEATNAAEQVAVDMLSRRPAAVVCVLDAQNMESSLYLLLQLLEHEIPTVVAVNRTDLLANEGMAVDVDYLSSKLGLPVVETVAVEQRGLETVRTELSRLVEEQAQPRPHFSSEKISDTNSHSRWEKAENLARSAYYRAGEDQTEAKESWDQLLVSPATGFPIALLVLTLIFGLVVGLGLGLRRFLLSPLFEHFVIPLIELGVTSIIPPGLWRSILIGEYGFLVKGLEWPFALVMPYVLSFYLGLTMLEDSGYMPRLGVLLDGILNKIGLSGGNIIPLLLGYGCAIPGILAARAMANRKERLTIAVMISLAVPCIAQTGAFISLLAEASIWLIPLVFLFSFAVLVLAGIILDLLISGDWTPTVLEIPELLLPRPGVIAKKIWLHFKHFLVDGAVPMVIGVGLAALLYETGAMEIMAYYMRPLVDGWLGLPEEAATPLLLGIMRRELTVLPLLDMELSFLQLFVGSVVGLFYVPCIAVIATLAKEYGIRVAAAILLLTTTTAFVGGGLILRAGWLLAAMF